MPASIRRTWFFLGAALLTALACGTKDDRPRVTSGAGGDGGTGGANVDAGEILDGSAAGADAAGGAGTTTRRRAGASASSTPGPTPVQNASTAGEGRSRRSICSS